MRFSPRRIRVRTRRSSHVFYARRSCLRVRRDLAVTSPWVLHAPPWLFCPLNPGFISWRARFSSPRIALTPATPLAPLRPQAYLHAAEMYDVGATKHRTLVFGLATVALVGLGGAHHPPHGAPFHLNCHPYPCVSVCVCVQKQTTLVSNIGSTYFKDAQVEPRRGRRVRPCSPARTSPSSPSSSSRRSSGGKTFKRMLVLGES